MLYFIHGGKVCVCVAGGGGKSSTFSGWKAKTCVCVLIGGGDLYKLNLKRNAECGECAYRLRCAGGCRASALGSDPTDIMGPDRAACLLFLGEYIPRIMSM